MTDIPIDTDDYEHRFGKPVGRAFWSFRIVSVDSIRDHVFTTLKAVIFQEGRRQARELAKIRGSEREARMTMTPHYEGNCRSIGKPLF
jgi:hypothetical protein